MSWISVEDKYPDCYHRVLCHRPDKHTVIGRAIVGTNFCHFKGEDGFQLLEVTHWQPLPEPPKELK